MRSIKAGSSPSVKAGNSGKKRRPETKTAAANAPKTAPKPQFRLTYIFTPFPY